MTYVPGDPVDFLHELVLLASRAVDSGRFDIARVLAPLITEEQKKAKNEPPPLA